MPAPVVPSDFCQLTPTPGTDPCEAIKRIFFEQPALICQLLQYMFDENGNPTEEFIKDSSPVPVGTVVAHAGITPPARYLLCDGREVSRTTYSDLFVVIGTIYGAGDGVDTFNLPNLTGRTVFGLDNADPDFDNGISGGEKTHELTEDELAAHVHDMTFASDTAGGGQPVAGGTGNNSGFGTFNTSSTGGGQAHNNMPPYLAMQWIIKF